MVPSEIAKWACAGWQSLDSNDRWADRPRRLARQIAKSDFAHQNSLAQLIERPPIKWGGRRASSHGGSLFQVIPIKDRPWGADAFLICDDRLCRLALGSCP